jgi:hypothetical protein
VGLPYGSKSERFENLTLDQLALAFNEIEESANQHQTSDTETISYARKKKGKARKSPFRKMYGLFLKSQIL